MDDGREAESAPTKALQLARSDASCQAQGKRFESYAIGGAREILKVSSGPAMRIVSTGKDVVPSATGAEIWLATRCEVAV